MPLAGGATTASFRVEARERRAVLKAYFRHPDDSATASAPEFAFARFAWAAGIRCIPQPLAATRPRASALFEFVEGKRPAEVTADATCRRRRRSSCAILNAARWRAAASPLPLASEACFSLAEHFGTVGPAGRSATRRSDIDRDAADSCRDELASRLWSRVRRTAEAVARDSGLSLGRPLDATIAVRVAVRLRIPQRPASNPTASAASSTSSTPGGTTLPSSSATSSASPRCPCRRQRLRVVRRGCGRRCSPNPVACSPARGCCCPCTA